MQLFCYVSHFSVNLLFVAVVCLTIFYFEAQCVRIKPMSVGMFFFESLLLFLCSPTCSLQEMTQAS